MKKSHFFNILLVINVITTFTAFAQAEGVSLSYPVEMNIQSDSCKYLISSVNQLRPEVNLQATYEHNTKYQLDISGHGSLIRKHFSCDIKGTLLINSPKAQFSKNIMITEAVNRSQCYQVAEGLVYFFDQLNIKINTKCDDPGAYETNLHVDFGVQ